MTYRELMDADLMGSASVGDVLVLDLTDENMACGVWVEEGSFDSMSQGCWTVIRADLVNKRASIKKRKMEGIPSRFVIRYLTKRYNEIN